MILHSFNYLHVFKKQLRHCFKKYYGKSPARMRQEQKEANA